MKSGLTLWTSLVVGFLLFSATFLAMHAWSLLQVRPIWSQMRQMGTPQDLVVWVDSQIAAAKEKVQRLDPGPPPPWYAPNYYYEWLPKERLYGEAQETLSRLQKQRREVMERGMAAGRNGRVVWNAGIAPVLHLLLAITLILASLRLCLRVMLIQRRFGWVRL